jgi:hypothetical protein
MAKRLALLLGELTFWIGLLDPLAHGFEKQQQLIYRVELCRSH